MLIFPRGQDRDSFYVVVPGTVKVFVTSSAGAGIVPTTLPRSRRHVRRRRAARRRFPVPPGGSASSPSHRLAFRAKHGPRSGGQAPHLQSLYSRGRPSSATNRQAAEFFVFLDLKLASAELPRPVARVERGELVGHPEGLGIGRATVASMVGGWRQHEPGSERWKAGFLKSTSSNRSFERCSSLLQPQPGIVRDRREHDTAVHHVRDLPASAAPMMPTSADGRRGRRSPLHRYRRGEAGDRWNRCSVTSISIPRPLAPSS